MRENGTKSGKNISGSAYDITTMQYHDSGDGMQQKYNDDMVRHRAERRTYELVTKGESRVQYDIINGAGKEPPMLPQAVPKPVIDKLS